jgi:hypothetical protein
MDEYWIWLKGNATLCIFKQKTIFYSLIKELIIKWNLNEFKLNQIIDSNVLNYKSFIEL